MREPDSWRLAGLYTEKSGTIDRTTLPTAFFRPTTVELKEAKLLWRGRGDRLEPGSDILAGFLNLSEASDEKILDYARANGVLALCAKHGMPCSGWPHLPEVEWCNPLGWTGWDNPSGFDPTDAWRFYARRARAVLDVAAALHRGQPASPEAMQALSRVTLDPAGEAVRNLPQTLSAQRAEIGAHLQFWIWHGGVIPQISWRENRPEIRIGGTSLFGELGLQLILAVGRIEGLACCSECGRFYPPTRRPRADQRNYCPVCSESGAPLRYAQTARKRRKENTESRKPE